MVGCSLFFFSLFDFFDQCASSSAIRSFLGRFDFLVLLNLFILRCKVIVVGNSQPPPCNENKQLFADFIILAIFEFCPAWLGHVLKAGDILDNR